MIPLFVVDAFADRPFSGNPAAVCLLEAAASDAWMQQVAAEMNLSETAFVIGPGAVRNLRWFTPAVEVDLCGHATLAAAHVLWESGTVEKESPVSFETRSGELTARQDAQRIELDFPASGVEPAKVPDDLAAALGIEIHRIGRTRFDYLVEAVDAEAVRACRPDFTRLGRLGIRGVIITARSDAPQIDIVSRFFAPGSGIDEDPVTGSAHCALGPYWSEQLGKRVLQARQDSARGGVLEVETAGDRVFLRGEAIIIHQGHLRVPPA